MSQGMRSKSMSRVWMKLDGTQLGPEKSVSNQQGEDTGDDKEGDVGFLRSRCDLLEAFTLAESCRYHLFPGQ